MTKHESIPPSASEVVDQIVRNFIKEDPENPFGQRILYAKQQLALKIVIDIFGDQDHFAQACQRYAKILRLSYPVDWDEFRGEAIAAELDAMLYHINRTADEVTETIDEAIAAY